MDQVTPLIESPASRRIIQILLVLIAALVPRPDALSATSTRQPAIIQTDYAGAHPDVFAAQLDRMRLLIRQAQLEVSSRLGLVQYQDGFLEPVIVQFKDQTPAGTEYAMAYVAHGHVEGKFAQALVVNVEVLDRSLRQGAAAEESVDGVIYHEMTHVVLNDAAGESQAAAIPRWAHEGLAIYVAEPAHEDQFIRQVVGHVNRSWLQANGGRLDWGAHANTSLAYVHYALAVRFICEKGGINSLQSFVRNLIAGQSTAEAISDSLGMEWPQFQQQVKEYILKKLLPLSRQDIPATPNFFE